MDYGFARAKQQWEASDGAVYLLREVAGIAPLQAAGLLPVLAKIAALGGFGGCWQLKENIWKQLPEIASHLGVQVSNCAPGVHLSCCARHMRLVEGRTLLTACSLNCELHASPFNHNTHGMSPSMHSCTAGQSL